MSDPLLVQYEVLANQRIHFGKLFWQSIAFLFALLLSLAAIIDDLNMLSTPPVLVVGGGDYHFDGIRCRTIEKARSPL